MNTVDIEFTLDTGAVIRQGCNKPAWQEHVMCWMRGSNKERLTGIKVYQVETGHIYFHVAKQ